MEEIKINGGRTKYRMDDYIYVSKSVINTAGGKCNFIVHSQSKCLQAHIVANQQTQVPVTIATCLSHFSALSGSF